MSFMKTVDCCWQPQWWCDANTIGDKAHILIWMWYKLYINFFPHGRYFVHVTQVWSRKSMHEKVWLCCLFMHFSANFSINIDGIIVWPGSISLNFSAIYGSALKNGHMFFWINSINCSWSGPILSDVLNHLNAKLVGRKVDMYLPL